MIIYTKSLKPSWQAAARAEEMTDVRSDLQARLADQSLQVSLNGGDLLTLQQSMANGLGGCSCEQCIRVRLIIARSLHRLQLNDLDRDRIRRLIDPADRWHPGLMSAAMRLAERDGQGGQKP